MMVILLIVFLIISVAAVSSWLYRCKILVINQFPPCKWKVLEYKNVTKDDEYINTTEYINILNELNIFYFLSFGSELAAFRDGSKKKGDHDVDMHIPIWKNYKIFHCNNYEKLNNTLFNNKNVHLYENYTVCGKNRKYYIDVLKNYLLKQWGKYNVKINAFSLSMHVYLHYNPHSYPLHYDFWIFMSNEYVYRDLNLCIVSFQSTKAIVSSNPHPHLQLLYGNYLIPSSRQASDGYSIHSPNKP